MTLQLLLAEQSTVEETRKTAVSILGQSRFPSAEPKVHNVETGFLSVGVIREDHIPLALTDQMHSCKQNWLVHMPAEHQQTMKASFLDAVGVEESVQALNRPEEIQ